MSKGKPDKGGKRWCSKCNRYVRSLTFHKCDKATKKSLKAIKKAQKKRGKDPQWPQRRHSCVAVGAFNLSPRYKSGNLLSSCHCINSDHQSLSERR